MMVAREAKIRKYSDSLGIDAVIKSKLEVVEVGNCPLVITSRGICCLKSAEDLIGLRLLSRKVILLISMRFMEGNLKEFWIFRREHSKAKKTGSAMLIRRSVRSNFSLDFMNKRRMEVNPESSEFINFRELILNYN